MAALVGTVIAYGAVVDAGSPPPAGWLLCDGRAVSRHRYAELFKVIGTLHGAGDGVGTFSLPDYRGRFHRGSDRGTGRDPEANEREAANIGGATGDNVGSIQPGASGVPTGKDNAFKLAKAGTHQHQVKHLPTGKSWYHIAGSRYAAWTNDPTDSAQAGKHTHSISGGGDKETVPTSAYVHYLIACGEVSAEGGTA
jgi:microcystin-dependent protein